MRAFALAPEIEELRAAAERLARSELAPNVPNAEAAGRWPDAVLAVLDGFPLSGLDLSDALGGEGAGLLGKASCSRRSPPPTPAACPPPTGSGTRPAPSSPVPTGPWPRRWRRAASTDR